MTDCTLCTRWESDADLRIAELEYSFVMLNRDQYFPGYTLLFTKCHATELFHLEKTVRQGLCEEVVQVAAALNAAFKPDKMNYELLGNMMPHIHWHLVPRFASDPLWPRPIWAEPHTETIMEAREYLNSIRNIQSALQAVQ